MWAERERGSSHAGGKGVRRELIELCGDLSSQARIRGRCSPRSHSLGTCASLDSTMIQGNMAHVSLNHYMENENNVVPQALKEGAPVRGWRLKPTRAHFREDGDLFAWLT